MRYLTIKIFNFDELNEEVKSKAIKNYRNEYTCDQNPWADENSESIRKIAEAINSSYEIDSYNHCFFTSDLDEEMLELKGKRAIAYVWNNFIEPNLKPKYICGCKIDGKLYYGCVGKGSISYYSKVTKEFNCPFTGYCADMLLWDAWVYFKDEVRKFNNEMTVEAFINRVGYTVEKFLDDEDDWYDSDEYIIEEIEANNVEFYEDEQVYVG